MDDDDEPTALDNHQLDSMWRSVTGASMGLGDGAGAGAPHLGVPIGGATFDVDMTRAGVPRRVLPEDGTYTTARQDPTEGGRYGPEWRAEEQSRERVLEADKNYQFLTLVAGAANAPVERMYDDDSIGRAFRARLAAEQVRMQIAETQQSAESLDDSLQVMETQQLGARVTQGVIANFRVGDGVLRELPLHEDAVRDYIVAQRYNVDMIAIGNLLYTGHRTARILVPGTLGTVIDRALTVLFGDSNGNDLMADQPYIKIPVGAPTSGPSLTPQALMNLVFYHPTIAAPDTSNGATMRSVLANAYRGAFNGRQPTLASASADSVGADVGASMLRTAVQRLVVLQWIPVYPFGDFSRPLANYVDVASVHTLANAITFLEGDALGGARAEHRRSAIARWIGEARAFVAVIRTAFSLHSAESPLRAPRDTSPIEAVSTIARRAGNDARDRLLEAGFSAELAAIEGNAVAANIRANPPNHIFAGTTVGRAAIRATIETVGGYVDAAMALGGANEGALRALGIDVMIIDGVDRSFPPGLVDVTGTAATLAAWSAARKWYEQLGGTLFRDVDVWDVQDGEFELVQRNAFPERGVRGRDMLRWGVDGVGVAPPGISAQTRALWNTYVPIYRRALAKINASIDAARAAAPAAADPPPPPSGTTPDEDIVYSTLRGGTSIPDAQRESAGTGRTRWPIFVTLGRLLLADVNVTAANFETNSEQRAAVIAATRARLVAMRTGVPVPRAIVEPPYQHRRGWVERPEHSGIIKLKPIVVTAIGNAWGTLERAAPRIVQAVGNDVEALQKHSRMRVDFAELVAVHMAMLAQRFPTRYHQLGQRAYNKLDWIDVVQRFQYSYDVGMGASRQLTTEQFFSAAEGGGGAAAAGSEAHVRVRPTNATFSGRGYSIV